MHVLQRIKYILSLAETKGKNVSIARIESFNHSAEVVVLWAKIFIVTHTHTHL